MRLSISFILYVVLALAASAGAQSFVQKASSSYMSAAARQERLAFEVASIKERQFTPGLLGVDYRPGGRLVATQAPMLMLIWSAYNILPTQLQAGPNVPTAVMGTYYDIEAKSPAGVIPTGALSRESMRKMESMLQTLLADRFKLQVHTEKKELPVYALVIDKNGLKLPKAPDRDCGASPSPCRFTQVGPSSGINGQSVTLEQLAGNLTFFAGDGRSVVNKTGVEGRFDITLPPFSRGAVTPGTLIDGVPADLNAPSLANILRDVGLRLEPRTELLDVYIVDHVEKPSAN